MTWRVGTKIPLNLYKDERPVCRCHNEEDARELAAGMNAAYALAEGMAEAIVEARRFMATANKRSAPGERLAAAGKDATQGTPEETGTSGTTKEEAS